MKGVIDLYKLKDPYSGLGQVCQHLAQHLAAEKTSLELTYLLPHTATGNLIQHNNGISHIKNKFLHRYLPFLSHTYAFWHSIHQFPAHLPNKHTPFILTVHDLNFLVEKKKEKAAHYLKRLQQNIHRADYITAISQFTKQQLLEHTQLSGKEVQVIYNGVALPQTQAATPKPPYIQAEKFFFSIGVFKPSKNLHTLLPLIRHFDNHQLIIAGNTDTPYGNKVKQLVADLQLQKKVLLPGKISEHDKHWLYHHCQAFLFPSLAEGFGLPVVEAMSAGKPTFLSKQAALLEIGADLAYYFNTFDDTDMANCIHEGLQHFHQNPLANKEKLIQHSALFNWTNSARQYLSLYNQALKHRA